VKRINIIGCGQAAGSLARLWLQADSLVIGDVLNRSAASTESAVKMIGSGKAAYSIESMQAADFWLIGTSDQQISSVAHSMAANRSDLEGAIVFHLAGRFGVDVLTPLQEEGAALAALHPVRSLTHSDLSLNDFEGTACIADGAPAALEALKPLITSIRGNWLPVSNINRGLYHAAVAITSNVTKGISWKAQNWLQEAGLPAKTSAAVTHQLLQSTMEDLFRIGARQSITGPVVRGDTSTIEAHIAALQSVYPDDVDVYRILARTVLELAQDRGDLDEATLKRFQKILGNTSNSP
jgi:predicted short-subunit dehydrogenase-like oxidoreductase (DUF2520 family)